MQSNRKEWHKPSLRLVDAESIFERAWNREQLLGVRSLIESGVELVETDRQLPDIAAKFRSVLAAIDAELVRSQ